MNMKEEEKGNGKSTATQNYHNFILKTLNKLDITAVQCGLKTSHKLDV